MDGVLRAGANCGSELSCLKRQNIHWRPQSAGCPYCHINYQVIGKVETFADDVKYIVVKQNLTHLIPVNVTSLKTHASKETARKSKTITYFQQLTNNQIRSLYQFYKPDFELFDYKANEYLSLNI